MTWMLHIDKQPNTRDIAKYALYIHVWVMLSLSCVAVHHTVHSGRLMQVSILQRQAFATARALRSRSVSVISTNQTLSLHRYSIPQLWCRHVAAATGGLRARTSASAASMAAQAQAGPAAALSSKSEAPQPAAAAPPATAATDQQKAHDGGSAPPAKPGKRKVAMHVAYIGTAFRGAAPALPASPASAEQHPEGIRR